MKMELRKRILNLLREQGGTPYDGFLLKVLPGRDYTQDRELEMRDVLAELVLERLVVTDQGWYRLADAKV